MRVSLQIDGDATGAKQAAQVASAAVKDLSKDADKAGDSVAHLAGAAAASGAANDNTAASVGALAQKIADLASKTLGSGSAFTKAAAGASGMAEGIGSVVRSAGGLSLVTGAIGLAITAAVSFYGVVNSGSADAARRLEETARLVGVVRDAYSGAATSAGEFLTQSKAITALQAQQSIIALQAEQKKQAGTIVNTLAPTAPQLVPGAIGFPGEDGFNNGLTGALFPDQANQKLSAFQGAFDGLRASIAAGVPDIEKFRDDIAAIGNAAAASNPEVAAAAAGLLKTTQAAADNALALKKSEAIMAVLGGTATETQKKLLGITTTANENAGAFERLSKSMDRQSASQEAEAKTAGLSIGAATKLRTEFILTEAAQQSGITVAGVYADKIKAIADRAGDAAQKLAQAKLQSDTAFQTSQLGRTAIDASVADQLKGTFGNDADQNSAIANAIRFNEQMKDLKGTVSDVANGAFTDLRTALQGGATAMQAFGTVANNVLNKILDKLANKTLDSFISGIFGSFTLSGAVNANGSIAGALGPTSVGGAPLVSLDGGGYTGPGDRYQPAGVVHRGEIVFSQDDVAAHGGVQAVENLRRMRGYAGGGPVGSPAPWAGRSWPSASSPSSSPAQIPVKIEQTFVLQGATGKQDIAQMIVAANQASAAQILKIVDDQTPARERQRQLLGN